MMNKSLSRLAATMQWCAPRVDVADPSGCLRSEELRPAENMNDWPAKVEAVCARRESLLNLQPLQGSELTAGRLLLFDPGQNLSDVAAMVESNGFFNAENEPPWDTWVQYVRQQPQRAGTWTHLDSYLVCWIPPAFLDVVDRAIEVNPEECFLWGDIANTPFVVRLFRQLQGRE
jgi:hypothetical protein